MKASTLSDYYSRRSFNHSFSKTAFDVDVDASESQFRSTSRLIRLVVVVDLVRGMVDGPGALRRSRTLKRPGSLQRPTIEARTTASF